MIELALQTKLTSLGLQKVLQTNKQENRRLSLTREKREVKKISNIRELIILLTGQSGSPGLSGRYSAVVIGGTCHQPINENIIFKQEFLVIDMLCDKLLFVTERSQKGYLINYHRPSTTSFLICNVHTTKYQLN